MQSIDVYVGKQFTLCSLCTALDRNNNAKYVAAAGIVVAIMCREGIVYWFASLLGTQIDILHGVSSSPMLLKLQPCHGFVFLTEFAQCRSSADLHQFLQDCRGRVGSSGHCSSRL